MDGLEEHDLVVLTVDKPGENLEKGDIGTVVHSYDKGGYEVEFITPGGKTVVVLTFTADEIRPAGDSEILHARLRPAS